MELDDFVKTYDHKPSVLGLKEHTLEDELGRQITGVVLKDPLQPHRRLKVFNTWENVTAECIQKSSEQIRPMQGWELRNHFIDKLMAQMPKASINMSKATSLDDIRRLVSEHERRLAEKTVTSVAAEPAPPDATPAPSLAPAAPLRVGEEESEEDTECDEGPLHKFAVGPSKGKGKGGNKQGKQRKREASQSVGHSGGQKGAKAARPTMQAATSAADDIGAAEAEPGDVSGDATPRAAKARKFWGKSSAASVASSRRSKGPKAGDGSGNKSPADAAERWCRELSLSEVLGGKQHKNPAYQVQRQLKIMERDEPHSAETVMLRSKIDLALKAAELYKNISRIPTATRLQNIGMLQDSGEVIDWPVKMQAKLVALGVKDKLVRALTGGAAAAIGIVTFQLADSTHSAQRDSSD